MGVEVGDMDAGTLKLLHLGDRLAFDIVFTDSAAQECLDEVDERGAKVFAVGAEERGNAFRGETGVPSVRRMWQPTPRAGLAWAMATASLNAAPVAIRVAEVRALAW